MVKTKYQLVWSTDSVWRLSQIYEWYATFQSISRAQKVIASLKNTARNISQNPNKHVQCNEIECPTPAIRKALVHKTFWIVFEIEETRIVILDIIHGSIDPDNYIKIV